MFCPSAYIYIGRFFSNLLKSFAFFEQAPPPMEKEDLSDFASDPKPLPQDVEMVSRLNPSVLYNALGSAFIL